MVLPAESERVCENCRFWEGPLVMLSRRVGMCHRYPPMERMLAPPDEFPRTAPRAWCGEFSPC